MWMIDKFSRIPIYEQLIATIETNVLGGFLPAGSQVPSLRELSAQLGINPNTIARSYTELSRRGILQAAIGSGYYVAPDACELIRKERSGRLQDIYTLACEMAMAGIPKEDVDATVAEAYQKRNQGGHLV